MTDQTTLTRRTSIATRPDGAAGIEFDPVTAEAFQHHLEAARDQIESVYGPPTGDAQTIWDPTGAMPSSLGFHSISDLFTTVMTAAGAEKAVIHATATTGQMLLNPDDDRVDPVIREWWSDEHAMFTHGRRDFPTVLELLADTQRLLCEAYAVPAASIDEAGRRVAAALDSVAHQNPAALRLLADAWAQTLATDIGIHYGTIGLDDNLGKAAEILAAAGQPAWTPTRSVLFRTRDRFDEPRRTLAVLLAIRFAVADSNPSKVSDFDAALFNNAASILAVELFGH